MLNLFLVVKSAASPSNPRAPSVLASSSSSSPVPGKGNSIRSTCMTNCDVMCNTLCSLVGLLPRQTSRLSLGSSSSPKSDGSRSGQKRAASPPDPRVSTYSSGGKRKKHKRTKGEERKKQQDAKSKWLAPN